MITSRRSFITGLVSFVAAPAIVRAGSLMPVKVMEQGIRYSDPYRLSEWILEDAERRINPPFIIVSPTFKGLFDEAVAR